MHTNRSKGLPQTIQSLLLLAGAFTFAFLLGEMVHDSGHYFCHQIYGNTQVQVHFDPFGGTHISGANGLPGRVLGVTSAAGPLSNLALGITVFLLLWRKRRPILLPLLMWGPVGMIQESVTFSFGLLTSGGDAAWIATLGIPQPLILGIGVLLLIAGLALLAVLLPLAGLQQEDAYPRKLALILVGMCSLMLIRFAHSFFVAPDSVVENLIPLVFSLLLALVMPALQTLLDRNLGNSEGKEVVIVTWRAAIVSLISGAGMFVLQLI